MKKKGAAFAIVGLLMMPGYSLSQGCSDAGVCTIGSLKHSRVLGENYHSLTFSNTFGVGEAGGAPLYIQTIQIEGRLALGNGHFNIKLPLQFVSGNLSRSTVGVGDIAISYSQRVISTANAALSVTLGARLPANKSTLSQDGLPLPMQYQSSLGSSDFVIGASLLYSSWHLAVGYQHPFTRNENGFLRNLWPDDSNADDYFESNRFKRGDDLMVRVQRSFRKKSATFFVGILPILRLQKDEIVRNGRVVKLKGSDELTLNINFSYLRELSKKTNLRLSIGSPIVWRKTRADGLTRAVVMTTALELRI